MEKKNPLKRKRKIGLRTKEEQKGKANDKETSETESKWWLM